MSDSHSESSSSKTVDRLEGLDGVAKVAEFEKQDGGKVLLLGTSHACDKEQMRGIAWASESFYPDCVAIELDGSRAHAVAPDVFPAPQPGVGDEPPSFMLSDPTMLLAFGSLAEQSAGLTAAADGDYGADMVAGIEVARHRETDLVLLDRHPRVTAARSTLGAMQLIFGEARRLNSQEKLQFAIAVLAGDTRRAAALCAESAVRDASLGEGTRAVLGADAVARNRIRSALYWHAAGHDSRTSSLRAASSSSSRGALAEGSLVQALAEVERLGEGRRERLLGAARARRRAAAQGGALAQAELEGMSTYSTHGGSSGDLSGRRARFNARQAAVQLERQKLELALLREASVVLREQASSSTGAAGSSNAQGASVASESQSSNSIAEPAWPAALEHRARELDAERMQVLPANAPRAAQQGLLDLPLVSVPGSNSSSSSSSSTDPTGGSRVSSSSEGSLSVALAALEDKVRAWEGFIEGQQAVLERLESGARQAEYKEEEEKEKEKQQHKAGRPIDAGVGYGEDDWASSGEGEGGGNQQHARSTGRGSDEELQADVQEQERALEEALGAARALQEQPPSLMDLQALRVLVRQTVAESVDLLAASRDPEVPAVTKRAVIEEQPVMADAALLDERDELLAYRLWSAPGRRVLGVVGAAHVDGVRRRWGRVSAERAAALTQAGGEGVGERFLLPAVGLMGAGLAAAQARSRGVHSTAWRVTKGLGIGALAVATGALCLSVRMLQFQREVHLRMAGWRDRMRAEEERIGRALAKEVSSNGSD